MPQVIPARTPNDPYHEENDQNVVEVQEYQVDSISISSNQDSQYSQESEEEFNTENAIVVNDKPHIPHFGRVSVVNSNDVHFGNKTVYKGPVTIKQFVYPNGDITSDSESGSNGVVKKINGGLVNEGFILDQKDKACDVQFTKANDNEERVQEANNGSRVRQGLKWIKTVSCKWLKLTILCLFILAIALSTIGAVLIWKNSSKVIQNNDNDEKPAEEDNIVPVDYTSDSGSLSKLRIMNRLIWLAQPPSGPINNLTLPVSLVIVHHTATVTCSSQAQCVFQTRHIQTFHMESNGWNDIGYNFIVGGDGAVYIGRGWNLEGAHTLAWNNVSIGVAFIGTYNNDVPSAKMLLPFQKLLDKGLELGYLTKDFKVAGARQFSGTESPGKAFYEVIKNWTRWSEVEDLKFIKS